MSGDPVLASIDMFGGNFAPRGWAFCDGQLLSIAQNTALFSILGTVFGGDGRTTFALPDLRGRVPIHQGNGPGLKNYSFGERGGLENVTLTSGQIPSHTHVLNGLGGANDSNFLENNYLASNRDVKVYGVKAAGENLAALNGESIGATGGNQSHTNVQPYLTINFCIATIGIFPSRN
jgi:microcystin-dependent protein